MVNSKLLRFLWIFVGLLGCASICFLWFLTIRNHFLVEPWIDKFADVGNLLGFLSLFFILLMTFLGTRPPVLEKPFGLGRLLRFHKKMAFFVIILIFSHVILKTIKYSQTVGWRTEDVWDFMLQFFPYSWDPGENGLIIGRWALLGVIVGVVFAKGGQYFLPFKIWKPFHFLIHVAGFFMYIHAFLVSPDTRVFPMSIGYYSLFALWIILVVYRFYYLATRKSKRRWFLESIKIETHDTHSCFFIRPEGAGAFSKWLPGQFALFRYKSSLLGWSEPHPFTISCAPDSDGKICCTVKAVGPFSAKLRTMSPGTAFLCEGPYGVFTPNFKKEKRLVFIAGGIGVTPFLSIVRYAIRKEIPTPITLIWGNKTRKDIVAYDELSSIVKSYEHIKVVHVLSNERITEEMLSEVSEDGFFWEEGLVGGAILEKYIDPKGASFYLCGPPAMQKFVLDELRRVFKISPRKVKRELFYY